MFAEVRIINETQDSKIEIDVVYEFYKYIYTRSKTKDDECWKREFQQNVYNMNDIQQRWTKIMCLPYDFPEKLLDIGSSGATSFL